MNLKYGLDDKLPLGRNWLFGLQWFFIALPPLLIIGQVVGSLHFSDPRQQVFYLQKISLVIGLPLLFGTIISFFTRRGDSKLPGPPASPDGKRIRYGHLHCLSAGMAGFPENRH